MLLKFYLDVMNWLQEKEEGQDFAEYALLLALIAIVVIAVFAAFSGALTGIFNKVSSALGVTPS